MTITYEKIAKRAFEIWEREGRPDGRDKEQWLRAEEELRAEGLKQQKGRKISSKDPNFMRAAKEERL